MACRASDRARGYSGEAHRHRTSAAGEPGLFARRVGIDGGAEQVAPGQGILPPAGRATARTGSRRDSRLRGRGRPRATLDAGQRKGADTPRARRPAGRWIDGRRGWNPARLQDGARQFPEGRQQPRHPRDRRRFQRRRVEHAGPGRHGRGAPERRRVPHGARLRHGQPEGRSHGEARRQGQWQLRVRRRHHRGQEGAGQRIRRDDVHDRKGREDPGGIQPGERAGVSSDRIREPPARQGGFPGRREGRRRSRFRSYRDRALRDRARRRTATRRPRLYGSSAVSDGGSAQGERSWR
jgi:hypothetical protein